VPNFHVHLPVAPLVEALERRGKEVGQTPRSDGGSYPPGVRTLFAGGPEYRNMFRAKLAGTVTIDFAEHLCFDILGVHPSEVFGEAWWEAETEEADRLDLRDHRPPDPRLRRQPK
jgi:hypothetical protein